MKPTVEDWYRLVSMVRDGEPLPPKAREFVAQILELVQRGADPREFAGTVPGDPRKNRRAIVGMHYWLLRAIYGEGGEDAARTEVAKTWHLSKDRVKTIGRNCKAFRPGFENADHHDLRVILQGILIEAPGGAMYRKRRPRKVVDSR